MGTTRLLETVNHRTRLVGRAVRHPYSDWDESDNDVLYAGEHDSAVRQVCLRNEWLTDLQKADDSCGEGCAQLDDFKWFLPADDRAGDLPARSRRWMCRTVRVEYIEPDSAPLQIKTMAEQLLCPPVVAQTRPMEGCDPASPWRLRRGRDVLTEDGAVAMDTKQVSAASDTVFFFREIHMKSECIPTVVPKLAMAPQAASEVVQPRPRDSCCMDFLPPVGECIELLGINTPDAVVSGMEVAGGSSTCR